MVFHYGNVCQIMSPLVIVMHLACFDMSGIPLMYCLVVPIVCGFATCCAWACDVTICYS